MTSPRWTRRPARRGLIRSRRSSVRFHGLPVRSRDPAPRSEVGRDRPHARCLSMTIMDGPADLCGLGLVEGHPVGCRSRSSGARREAFPLCAFWSLAARWRRRSSLALPS